MIRLLVLLLLLPIVSKAQVNRVDGVLFSPRIFTDSRTYVGWTFGGRATTDVIRAFELTNLFNSLPATGETNTAENLGTGWPAYDSKSGVSLRFNTWTNGSGLTSSSNNNVFTMAVATAGIQDSMLRNSSALSVIGRAVNSSGSPADISASSDGQVLSRSGTSLAFGTLLLTNTSFSNISFDTISSGQVISWDATANKWTNSTIVSAQTGETNTASNLGVPSGTIQPVFSSKSGVDLRFRSLEAGTGIAFSSNSTTLVLSSTVSGAVNAFTNATAYAATNTTDSVPLTSRATSGQFTNLFSAYSGANVLSFEVCSNGYLAFGNSINSYAKALVPVELYDTGTTKIRIGGSSTGTNVISTLGANYQALDLQASHFMFTPSIATTRTYIDGNGKMGINTNAPDEQLHVNGNAKIQNSIIFPPSITQMLNAGTTVLANATRIKVAGNGSAVNLNQTPTIADGSDGQLLYIMGTDNTNTAKFQDETTVPGSNLQLSGDASFTLSNGDFLVLMFDSSTSYWWEISRSSNKTGPNNITTE